MLPKQDWTQDLFDKLTEGVDRAIVSAEANRPGQRAVLVELKNNINTTDNEVGGIYIERKFGVGSKVVDHDAFKDFDWQRDGETPPSIASSRMCNFYLDLILL